MPIVSPSRLPHGLRRLAAPLAWSAYAAMPVAGWGWMNGVPVGPLEAAAVALVWWCWASTRELPGTRILVVLAITKVLLGGVFVERGFTARYYANDNWTAPVERSVEFRRHDMTRRDQRLAFGREGQPDLPLYFLNDLRFNFYQATDPERHRLAYSATWEGLFDGDGQTRERTFYLLAPDGAAAALAIDGREVLPLEGAPDRTASVAVGPGWHALTVRVSAPYGAGRAIEAGEISGGGKEPFGAGQVISAPAGQARLTLDAVIRWLSRGVDLFVLGWLAWIAGRHTWVALRERRVGRLLWLAAIAEAVAFAAPYAPRLTLLTGSDDWLTYEYFSREISLGDPLLRRSRLGGGQGAPFYYQPLYPYFVALTHLVFGESIWGVVVTQRLLLAATVGWAAAITRRLFGARAGWLAIIGGGLFLYAKGGRWTRVLLAEPFFMPLLTWWIWWMVRTASEAPSRTRLIVTGMVGGVATLARSTLLLGWPLIVGAWSTALRARKVRTTVVLLTIMISVVGTATLRNWIVSRTFVPVTTSFGINLYLGNPSPRTLEPVPAPRKAFYEWVAIEGYTQAVVEYAVQAPGDFFRNLGRKTLYSVGLFGWSGFSSGEKGVSLAYLGMWCAALAGFARVVRSNATWPLAVMSLPLLAALSHLGVVVLIFPYVYGDRLILPLYPLLIPYAAFAIDPLFASMRMRAPRAASYLFSTPDVSSTTMATARMRFSELRMPRVVPVLAALAALVLATLAGAYYFTREPAPEIRIRWSPGIDAARRSELERRFRLVRPSPFEDRLTYDLLDTSSENVAALVDERDIQDTDRVDRVNRRIPPDVPYGSSWMWIAHRLPVLRNPGVVLGLVLGCVGVLAMALGALVEGWRVRKKLSRP